MYAFRKILPLLFCSLFSSCFLITPIQEPPPQAAATKTDSSGTSKDYSNLEFETGTVHRSQLDGCRWLIGLDSKKSLEPSGVPDEFLIDGLRVRVKYVLSKNQMSICMSGTVVRIVAIEKLDQ
ncbi:MAG TPA: hypothetical protein VNZ86_13130 [Bacteroidia bacterium]|jgi:hypothetical protein|nr:hypothetical protein [Bacteroidia bacterium]